jgi:hypothetical protein
MKQVVKQLADYPCYFVDICGRFWSKRYKQMKLLSPVINTNTRYCQVKFYDKDLKRQKCLSAHRLVAEAFIPNPNNYPMVCHKNNIKTDNRIENLYWGTCGMNIRQAFQDNLVPTVKGEKHYMAKLNNEKAKLIRLLYDTFNWKIVKIARILGKAWGINSDVTIFHVVKNHTWKQPINLI